MPAETRPDRVAVYIRWSTDDQATGTTLEVQREGCEFYVRSQGWLVRDDLVFIDDGYSGGNMDRPAIARMRQMVRAGEIDCVVVLKIDRLSRNIVDAVDLVLREWAGKCNLKSVREPIDTTNDLGRMIFGILAMFADFERATIRERTQTGKTRRIAEGKQLHAEPALGYMRHPTEKGRWVEHPAEAPLVRRIFAMAQDGMSANRICRQLNREGIRTRAGKEWSVRSILWILHNRLYIGEVTYGRTSLCPVQEDDGGGRPTLATHQGRRKLVRVTHDAPKIQRQTQACPPLVDEATFAAAAARLRANQSQRRSMGSRAMGSPHLLAGIAQCTCGGALVHKVQSGRQSRERGIEYRHYICARSRQGTCTENGHIPAEAAELMVEQQFLNLYGLKGERDQRIRPWVHAALTERSSIAGALDAADRDLARLGAEEKRLLREARGGSLTPEDFRALRQSIEQDRTGLRDRVQTLRGELEDFDAQVQTLESTLAALDSTQQWGALPAAERRQLLRMLLRDRVTISKPKGSREIRVEVPWAF